MVPEPPPDGHQEPPLEALGRFERWAVRLARTMHRDPWNRLCALGQRQVGARWIALVAGPLLQVHGLEHVAATDRGRPLLLVANHRSFFDLYVVMSTLYRRVPGFRSAVFPVRGRYFYQHPGGMVLNACIANWAMYPPFFHEPRKRRFDQWALAELARLCREGEGRLVGFHPEGTRNKSPDPYTFLPAQPGVGRLILEAEPVVLPAFIAGLSNRFGEIVRRRVAGGDPIRLRFGPALDYAAFRAEPRVPATYRRLAEAVMARIAELGDADRRARG